MKEHGQAAGRRTNALLGSVNWGQKKWCVKYESSPTRQAPKHVLQERLQQARSRRPSLCRRGAEEGGKRENRRRLPRLLFFFFFEWWSWGRGTAVLYFVFF